jgi:hypothetical protein
MGLANRQTMRNNQNKRMRGGRGSNNNNNNNNNNNRKGQNPLGRVFESNGPDVKIRGNPSHIAEKYLQLARDAQSSGDPVAAENYFQHAEHYFRLIAAAQEQFRQTQPQFYRPDGEQPRNDDTFDEGDEADGGQPNYGASYGQREPHAQREPQPYMPREAQPFPRDQQQPAYQPRQQPQGNQPPLDAGNDVTGLPSFITGGQPPQPPQANGNGANGGPNGYEGNQPDRFPLHRRRRRHRGPRPDFQGSPDQPQGGAEGE